MRNYRGVLVTGAAGGIGRMLRDGLRGRYPLVRWTDIRPMDDIASGEEAQLADLSDLAAVERLMQGIDAVVHLGGVSIEGSWEAILPANIEGTYNVYEAARRSGVKRVVFASSNHAVGFHRRTHVVGPDAPVRPDSRYGVAKVFGEALARLYADKHGIETVSLRIGQFRPSPTNARMLSLWISPADMMRLVQCSLDAQDVHFEVVYGISANARAWYDNPGATRIGYLPQDNAEDYLTQALAGEAEDTIGCQFQGGPFCSDEFDGTADNIV